MSTTAWTVVLDAFAGRLAEQWQALADGSLDTIEAFTPPPTLGPLPVELIARATALLDEATLLEDHARTRLAAMARETDVVRRFSVAAPPAPSVLLDRTA